MQKITITDLANIAKNNLNKKRIGTEGENDILKAKHEKNWKHI